MGKYAIRLGKMGSALGFLAGLIELSIGTKILPWIGNKENPTVLGLITASLSAVAFVSVRTALNHGTTTNDRKLAVFLGVLLPATICFTTVGRLWYLPGLLLILTCSLLAYEYWFDQSKVRHPKNVSGKSRVNQIIGAIGSLIVLASVGLSFLKSNFGLFLSTVIIESNRYNFEVLPMDIVRSTDFSGRVTSVANIEVSLVMIVYISLILGASIALISSLAQSPVFVGIGGTLVLAGLTLFIFWLPGILAQAEFPLIGFRNIIGSLGLGWYLSVGGMSLIMLSGLLGIKPR